MDQNTSLFLIALVAAISGMFSAWMSYKVASTVRTAKVETDVKLEVIRKDVNNNLTQSVRREQDERSQKRTLAELLRTLAPDDPAVKALLAAVDKGPAEEVTMIPGASR